MKKLLLFVGVGLMTVFTSCGPTQDDAVKFNDQVVADQKELLAMEEELIGTITDDADVSDVEKAYEKYVKFIDNTLKKYEEMDEFDKNDTFRKAMLELLKAFQAIAKDEYKTVVKIYGKSEEDLTEDDLDTWDSVIDDIESKEGEANDAFLEKQKVFADEFGFSLV